MKITEIKTFLMQVGVQPVGSTATPTKDAAFGNSRNWLFIKVMTDEGIYGVGEGSGWPRVIETAVKDLAHIVVGEDPGNIDRLWQKMLTASMGHGMTGTVGGGAMTAIEMALWDIKGKAMGQPVWNLLGGKFRDSIPVYGHARDTEKADRLIALGYRGIKLPLTGKGDIDRAYAIREHVGPDVDLMLDAHGPSWLTTQDAIEFGQALEGANMLFYEEPVAPENLDALQRVRDNVNIPIAAGERVSNIWGMLPYIERNLVDVIQPDTGRAGGITQMRKMAAMAESHFITMAPHSGSLGPVAEYAALHVMASIPNALMLEKLEFDWEGREDVITPVPKVVNGGIPIPTAPGLGVDIIEGEIVKYPSRMNVRADEGVYNEGTHWESVYFQPRRGRASSLRRTRS